MGEDIAVRIPKYHREKSEDKDFNNLKIKEGGEIFKKLEKIITY